MHSLPATSSHPGPTGGASCSEVLSRLGAFSTTAPGGAESIESSLPCETRIYARGEPGTAVYSLRSGIVRFQRTADSGERRIVRLAGRGDLIGQEALLHQPYADEAVSCTPVQLCRIPSRLVDRLDKGDTELVHELMRRWQHALDQAGAWAAELCSGVARRRVLKLLAELMRLADDQQEIWMPRREDMGAMLDLTVETASRVISQLRREGVLTSHGQRRALLDPLALAAALRTV